MLDDLPVHNEALGGDTLYSILLNYRWRELLAAAMTHYFRRDLSDQSLDNQDLLDDFLLDLYDVEGVVGKEITIERVFLAASRTTTSTTIVDVTGSGFDWTFTKPNIHVRCSNIVMNNSGANDTTVQIAIASVTVIDAAVATVRGAVDCSVACEIRARETALGNARALKLQFKVAAGTGTIFNAASLLWTITEWDD